MNNQTNSFFAYIPNDLSRKQFIFLVVILQIEFYFFQLI